MTMPPDAPVIIPQERNEDRDEAKVSLPPGKSTLHVALTPFEMRLLVLLAHGYTERQLEQELFLAGSTIRNHVTLILRKLGVKRRIEAAIYAWRNGIVDPRDAWRKVVELQRVGKRNKESDHAAAISPLSSQLAGRR